MPAVFATILAAAPSVLAEAPSAVPAEEARERFRRGVDLFREGDYRGALIEFKRANELVPTYKIQFNIAQTCLELQDYACALRGYEAYLEGGSEVPQERRKLAEQEMARLSKLVGALHISSNIDGAEISIDGVVAGHTPMQTPVLVGIGRHQVAVFRSPFPAATRVVDVAGGDKLDVRIEMAAAAPIVPVSRSAEERLPLVPAAPRPPPMPTGPPPNRAPFWGGVIVTGGLVAATAMTGFLALSAKGKLDEVVARDGLSSADLRAEQSTVRGFTTATDVLLVSAIVSAAVTTVVFFTTRPRASATAGGFGNFH